MLLFSCVQVKKQINTSATQSGDSHRSSSRKRPSTGWTVVFALNANNVRNYVRLVIGHSMKDELLSYQVDSIVVATGYKTLGYPPLTRWGAATVSCARKPFSSIPLSLRIFGMIARYLQSTIACARVAVCVWPPIDLDPRTSADSSCSNYYPR